MEDRSIRSARLCAGVSLILLVAVLCVGTLRSINEGDLRPYSTIAPVTAESEKAQAAAAISVFASDRNTVREAEIEQLEALCVDMSASDEIRLSAARRIMTLREWMEKEAVIEDVLQARGYELPVVTVHEDSVNVVLRAQRLSQQEAAVILELVMRETGVTGGNLKIIPIN